MQRQPNLHDRLGEISMQVQRGANAVRGGHLLGIRLIRDGAVNRDALALFGYAERGDYWTDGGEEYPVLPVTDGHFSLQELEEWRAYLLEQCVAHSLVIELPEALSTTPAEVEVVRSGVDHLLNHVPRLRVATAAHLEHRSEIALWIAKGVLAWPQAVRVLLESYARNGWGNATAAMRSEVERNIVEQTGAAERGAVLAQLTLRHGALHVASDAAPLDDPSFRTALAPYLDRTFAASRA
jgi:hypothetical protein